MTTAIIITVVAVFLFTLFTLAAILAAASDADDSAEEHRAVRKLYDIEEEDLTLDDKMALRRRAHRARNEK